MHVVRTRAPVPVVVSGAVLLGVVVGFVAVVLAATLGIVVAILVPLVLLAGLLVWQRPAWAIAILVASFPASQRDVAGVGVVQVAAVLAIAGVVVVRLLRGERLPSIPTLGWWLVGLWGLAAIASVVGIDPEASLVPLVALGVGVAVTFVVADVVTDDADRRLVVGLVLGVAAMMCAASLSGFGDARAEFGGTLVEGRSQGSFAQPNELGTFAAVTLLLATSWATTGERWRWGAVAVAGVSGAALLASLSRGAWIGTVLGLGALLVLRRSTRRQLVTGGVALVLLLAGAFFVAPANPQLDVVRSRAASFADPTGNPYDERPAIYREAIRQVRDSPLIGHGLESYSIVATRQLESGGSVAPEHAHNTLLAVATETGLPTAAGVIFFTLLTARRAGRRARLLEAEAGGGGARLTVLVASGSALCVLVGQGFVDFSLRNPTLQFLAFLLLGLLLSSLRRE